MSVTVELVWPSERGFNTEIIRALSPGVCVICLGAFEAYLKREWGCCQNCATALHADCAGVVPYQCPSCQHGDD